MSLKKYIKGCVSLKKCKSQGKAVEVTVNSKEENSYDFCLDFVQEFGLRLVMSPFVCSYIILEGMKMGQLFSWLFLDRKERQLAKLCDECPAFTYPDCVLMVPHRVQ
jgi:hypothetical protein